MVLAAVLAAAGAASDSQYMVDLLASTVNALDSSPYAYDEGVLVGLEDQGAVVGAAVEAALAPAPAVSPPVVVNTQFHAQSELGEYSYGYSNPTSSKFETRNANGQVEGTYSYLAPDGRVITNNYVADPYDGFRSSLAPPPGAAVEVPLPPPVGHDPAVAEIGAAIQAAEVYEVERIPEPIQPVAEPGFQVHQAVPVPSYDIIAQPNLIEHAVEHHVVQPAISHVRPAVEPVDYGQAPAAVVTTPVVHHVKHAPQPVVHHAVEHVEPVVVKHHVQPAKVAHGAVQYESPVVVHRADPPPVVHAVKHVPVVVEHPAPVVHQQVVERRPVVHERVVQHRAPVVHKQIVAHKPAAVVVQKSLVEHRPPPYPHKHVGHRILDHPKTKAEAFFRSRPQAIRVPDAYHKHEPLTYTRTYSEHHTPYGKSSSTVVKSLPSRKYFGGVSRKYYNSGYKRTNSRSPYLSNKRYGGAYRRSYY